jgi:hypothetical protein
MKRSLIAIAKSLGFRPTSELFSDGSELRGLTRESLLYVEGDLQAEVDVIYDGSRYTAYVDPNRCLSGSFRDADHVNAVRAKVQSYLTSRNMAGAVA